MGRLRPNAFTEAGYSNLDSLTANALKRGRNGAGYEIGFTFHDQGMLVDGTFTPEQVEAICDAVDACTDAQMAVKSIALIVQDARLDAMGDTDAVQSWSE